MNNKMMPILILLMVLLGLFGFYYLSNSSKQQVSQTSETDGLPVITDSVSQEESLKLSLPELLKLGKNYVCTFDYVETETESKIQGNIYVASAGNKMNGAFVMTQPTGEVTNTYVLSDGTYSYMWSPVMAQGIKTKIDPAATDMFSTDTPDSTSDKSTATPDLDMTVDFDCKSWKVDESKFIPPADVEFLDLSASMQQAQDQMDSTGADKCSLCAQLPDEAKSQCMVSMGCN